MLRMKVKSYHTRRLRQRDGVFVSSIVGERLNDVSLCITIILS